MRESGFAVLHANINKNVESANCLPPKEVMGGGGTWVRNYMQIWMEVDSNSKCNLIGI